MKAEIDRLNEAHGLNVEYSDNAKGAELKAKLEEAMKLANSPKGEVSVDSVPEKVDEEVEMENEKQEEKKVEPVESSVPEKSERKKNLPPGFVPTGDKIADTKAILDHAPKVRFIVPLIPGEDPKVTETVQINGYKYEIKKGHMVEIPSPVADLIARKYQIEMDVAQRENAYSTPEKANALS